MHSDILNDYLNKDVQVRIKTGDTYEGNLKLFDEKKEIVILSPMENSRRYRRREYGDTVLRQTDIIVVSEILPNIEEDKYDEDEMMKKATKYSLFSDDSDSDQADSAYFQADKQMVTQPAPSADKIKILQRLQEKLDVLKQKAESTKE